MSYIKSFLPQSLYSRFLLIIIIPWFLLQLAIIYVFFERHWQSVSSHMRNSITNEIILVFKLIDDHKYKFSDITFLSRNYLDFKINKLNEKKLKAKRGIFKSSLLNQSMLALKNNLINEKLEIKYIGQYDDANVEIGIRYREDLYQLIISKKRIYTPTIGIFIGWIFSAAIILFIISILFVRNQLKFIKKLSKATEYFGRGQDIVNFKPSGAYEVKLAGINFIKMKERIEQQINQRTLMLAGLSHDLKTPLTRIKLQLSMVESSDQENIKAINEDINEMQFMLDEYLSFINHNKIKEDFSHLDLLAMLNDIIQDQKIKIQIENNIKPSLNKIYVRPIAFKRALRNIIENANKYSDEAVIILEKDYGTLKIIIEDNGPGINEYDASKIFQPFYRCDHSRNLDISGSGLGLSIALDIILDHGGNIYLSKKNIILAGASFVIEIPY